MDPVAGNVLLLILARARCLLRRSNYGGHFVEKPAQVQSAFVRFIPRCLALTYFIRDHKTLPCGCELTGESNAGGDTGL